MGSPDNLLAIEQMRGQRKHSMINDGIAGLGSAWSSEKVSGVVERRNILHNWHFINPVNQRGLLEYVAPLIGVNSLIQTIDRWIMWNAVNNTTPGRIELISEGVRLFKGSHYFTFCQRVENPSRFLGFPLTFSAIVNNKLYSLTYVAHFHDRNTNRFFIYRQIADTGFYMGVQMRSDHNFLEIYIGSMGSISNGFKIGDYIDIQAIKLELGTISTLANDPPPNPALELAVCQRYQRRITHNGNGVSFVTHASDVRQNEIFFFIPLSAMRVAPVITNMNGLAPLLVRRNYNAPNETGFTFVVASHREHGVGILASKTNHGMADANLYSNPGTLLDANL